MSLPGAYGRRITFRMRLTLAFTGLVAVAGAAIIVAVSVFMRVVPTYLQPDTLSVSSLVSEAPLSPGAASTPGPTPSAGDGMAHRSEFTLRSPNDILNTSLGVSIVVLILLIAAGALVAWLLAGRLLRPLQAVNTAAQRAGTGSFDHRIGMTGPRDEVHDLADTFDEMLARLDRSFAASQRFAANASHELQTPLATTQTMLEVALADPKADAAELRAVASRVLATNRRSIETVSALLDLAELDERDDVAREPVDLVPLVRATLAEERDGATRRALSVIDELPASMTVAGDAVLLRQAISNLVRNAVRHNVDGGMLAVRAAPGDGAHTLIVENTGAELSPEIIGTLAEPFTRGSGRLAGDRGHGLGLAIVDSIAQAHHGSLRLLPRAGGGLVAALSLPRGPDSDVQPTA